MYKQLKAFSLIELLVVISIIALLSAVGVASYKSYQRRAILYPVYNEIIDQQKQIIQQYQIKGTWPGSWTFPSAAYNSNLRMYPTGGINGAGGLMIITNNLPSNLDSYCANGSGCQTNIAMLYVNGTYQVYCGIWSTTNAYDFPLSAYPPNCNCTNMQAMWGNGTPGGGAGTNSC